MDLEPNDIRADIAIHRPADAHLQHNPAYNRQLPSLPTYTRPLATNTQTMHKLTPIIKGTIPTPTNFELSTSNMPETIP